MLLAACNDALQKMPCHAATDGSGAGGWRLAVLAEALQAADQALLDALALQRVLSG